MYEITEDYNKHYFQGELFTGIGFYLYKDVGGVTYEFNFKEGLFHGSSKRFDPWGNLYLENTYDNGVLIKQINYDPGEKVTEKYYKNGKLKSKKSYDNGVLIEEENY